MAEKKKPSAKHKRYTDKNPGPVAESATKLAPPEPPPAPTVIVGRTEGAEGRDITLHRLEQVTNALERLVPNVTKLEAAAQRAKVESEEDFNKASNFISLVDQQWKQIEALRKSVKTPVDDYAALIQATFTPYLNRLKTAKENVRKLATDWWNREEERKRKEAEALRKQQEEEAHRIAQEHQAAGREDVAEAVLSAAMNAPVVVDKPVMTTVNAFGKRTVAPKRWKGEVTDREALLRGILEAKIPWVVIQIQQKEIDTVARQFNAEGTFCGIRCYQETVLQQR